MRGLELKSPGLDCRSPSTAIMVTRKVHGGLSLQGQPIRLAVITDFSGIFNASFLNRCVTDKAKSDTTQ